MIPIAGVISDRQQSIRKAVEMALLGVPQGLCHLHYLREAAKPIYEADRHAKKELKKQVRGVRVIERSIADSDDQVSETVRGYCLEQRQIGKSIFLPRCQQSLHALRRVGAFC